MYQKKIVVFFFFFDKILFGIRNIEWFGECGRLPNRGTANGHCQCEFIISYIAPSLCDYFEPGSDFYLISLREFDIIAIES